MSNITGSGPGPPPGWYADGQGNMRWWDGSRWTEHVQQGGSSSSPTGSGIPPSANAEAKTPWYKKKRWWALAAVVFLIALGAGGGDDDNTDPVASEPSATAEPTEEPAEEPTEEPTEEEPPAADVRCVKADQSMLNAIMTGQEDGVEGNMTATAGAAVRSEDHAKAYYIAVRFDAPSVEGTEGVWASNSLKPGGGLILAVDGQAKAFTVWPDADSTDAEMSSADTGAVEALECLK